MYRYVQKRGDNKRVPTSFERFLGYTVDDDDHVNQNSKEPVTVPVTKHNFHCCLPVQRNHLFDPQISHISRPIIKG